MGTYFVCGKCGIEGKNSYYCSCKDIENERIAKAMEGKTIKSFIVIGQYGGTLITMTDLFKYSILNCENNGLIMYECPPTSQT